MPNAFVYTPNITYTNKTVILHIPSRVALSWNARFINNTWMNCICAINLVVLHGKYAHAEGKEAKEQKVAIQKWLLPWPWHYSIQAVAQSGAYSQGKKIPARETAWRATSKVMVLSPVMKQSELVPSFLEIPCFQDSTQQHPTKEKDTTSDPGKWWPDKQLSMITICLTTPVPPPPLTPSPPKYPNIPEFGFLMNPDIFWIFQTQPRKILHWFCLCCRKKQGLAFLREIFYDCVHCISKPHI